MAKIVLKEVAKIVIVVKSCCHIKVLAVMLTARRSSKAVTDAVAMVNDYWPAVILSADRHPCNIWNIDRKII